MRILEFIAKVAVYVVLFMVLKAVFMWIGIYGALVLIYLKLVDAV